MSFPKSMRSGQKRAETAIAKLEQDIPVAHSAREGAFLMYVECVGDVKRAAELLHMDPVVLQRMVDREYWAERVKPILELRKSTSPRDVERSINRALNFVQAHRMRHVLERLVTMLSNMTDDELFSYTCSEVEKFDKDGNSISIEKKLNTRAMTDLAHALEKMHMLSYYALTDTQSERVRKLNDDGAKERATSEEIHSAIASAMTKIQGKTFAEQAEFETFALHAEARTDLALETSDGVPSKEGHGPVVSIPIPDMSRG